MVMVVVGGGPSTLRTVRQALEDKRPVVVLPDSGDAALEIYEVCFDGNEGYVDPPALAKRPERMQAEMRPLLQEIRRLGRQTTGVNREQAVSCFRVSNDMQDKNDLKEVVLKALLNDFDRSMDAIRLAVKWQNPQLIQFQMQETQEEDPAGLASALESALLIKSPEVVKVLIEFKADCTSVRLDHLFDTDPDVDPYQIFGLKNDSSSLRRSEVVEPGANAAGQLFGAYDQLAVKGSPAGQLVKEGCSWGFAVLIDLLDEHVSMCEMLTVRSEETPDNVLAPQWLDLMMWAVMVGEQELARELWRQTPDPLRSALLAALVCRQIAISFFGSVGAEAETLLEHADAYEDWAVGLIAQADLKEARVMLLSTDDRYPAGSHRSALELATEDEEYACKRFLDSRNCKTVVEEVYKGFTPEAPPSLKRLRPGPGLHMHPMYVDMNDAKRWLERTEHLQRVTLHPLLGVYVLPEQLEKDADGCEHIKKLWFLDAGILSNIVSTPRMKFVNNTISSFLFVVIFTIVLCGTPWDGSPWMYRSGTYLARPGSTGTISGLEIFIWFWTGCRLLDEIKQMYRNGKDKYKLEETFISLFAYFDNPMNIFELTIYFAILTAATMRSIAEGSYATYNDDNYPGHWEQMLDWCRALYAFSVLGLYLRFIELTKGHKAIGVLYIAIVAMMTDVGNWFVINIFVILGFGVAFTVLMPAEAAMSSHELDKPMYMALRALLGDFDLDAVQDAYNSATIWERPTQTMMPLLVLLYVSISTIVLVNLLIAQMSASYEKVTEKATQLWLFERMSLYKEYKDDRDAFPPPLNALQFLWDATMYCCHIPSAGRFRGFKLPRPLELGPLQYIQTLSCACRDRFLKEDDDNMESALETRVRKMQGSTETAALAERLRFEMIQGRLDKLEDLLCRVAAPAGTAPLQPGLPAPAIDHASARRRAAALTAAGGAAGPAGRVARPTSLTTSYLQSLARSPGSRGPLLRPVQPPVGGKEQPFAPNGRERLAQQPALAPQHRPPPPLLNETHTVFETFDRERRGSLDAVQLRTALTALGVSADLAEAQRVLSEYDSNANGRLELEEFSRLVADLRASRQPIPSPPPPLTRAALPRPQDPQYYSAEEAMELARLAVEEAMRAQSVRDREQSAGPQSAGPQSAGPQSAGPASGSPPTGR